MTYHRLAAQTSLTLSGLLAVFSVLISSGCSHQRVEARRLPAWVFDASRSDRPSPIPARSRPRGGIRGRSEAADLVVAALQDEGLRFGTDGTISALWGYLHTSHTTVLPSVSRTGDVLFFRTRVAPEQPCDDGTVPDHVGIVSGVDDDGRVSFVEARNGRVHHSYADPAHPRIRRDAAGRVLNSFLRPKRPGDPADAPNFAGEMLCAVVRPQT
jgi:hypothetical protein